jgi:beta-glucanase (GH16 family)
MAVGGLVANSLQEPSMQVRFSGLCPTLGLVFLLAPFPTLAQQGGTDAPTLGSGRDLPGGHARLTFSDEFSGTTLDRSVWTTNYTNVIPSLPKELQIYLPDNFSVSDGVLHIRTDNRTVDGFEYSSGAMTTFGSFVQRYGYFEIKAKVPVGKGLFPAFWLLPWDKTWPPEIDVMEFLGRDVTTIYTTYHYTDPKTGHQNEGSGIKRDDWSKDYHVFAADWRPNLIVWYIDGKEVKRFSGAHVVDMAMFMLLNTTVGVGDWVGNPDSSTPFPSYFDIDYVRAWQYDDIPPAPTPEFRYLVTTTDKEVAAASEVVTFDFGLDTYVDRPPMVFQVALVDSTGKKQIADATFPVPASKPSKIRRQWRFKLPGDLKPGLYAMSFGVFDPDWKQLDWLTNARTVLVK